MNLKYQRVDDFAVDVAPAIAGVLGMLPTQGTHWPDVEKAKFLCALGAVLDIVYPAAGDDHEVASGDQT